MFRLNTGIALTIPAITVVQKFLPMVLVLLAASFPTAVHCEPATLDVPADSAALHKIVVGYDRRIAVNPDDAEAYLKRGEARFKLHEFDKAIEDFNAALQRNDGLDDAYFGRGMSLGRRGEIDEGIADLSVYIRRNPDSSLAYTKRGVRYIWKGDLGNAEKDLKRAIALDANNAEAHDDLGVILAQHGNYPLAIDHFQTCIKRDPYYQKAYHNLAMVYYITDQTEKALRVVNQSLKLNPASRDSLLLKSNILEMLGRHAEAVNLR
jgi:tetratricopeptide (TPR) repeat protein